jgi:plasmid stabilization system protein ParE
LEKVRRVKVRYTIDALLHIAALHTYIDERNPVAATRVVARIRAAAERLGEFPLSGRAGALTGTREWVVHGLPYIIVHEVNETAYEVVILGVYHGAQLRPGQDAG